MKPHVTLFRFFSSLRLTVVLLAFSLILVFFGTLDQVKWGIHHTQKLYFESFVVLCPVVSLLKTFFAHSYDASLEGLRIPLPGGFTLGGLLLINLLAAHFRYFKFTWAKSGITIMHFGVVLLLLSGFMVSMMQRESVMSLDESGPAMNYSNDFYRHEIYLKDITDAEQDLLSSIIFDTVKAGQTIDLPSQQGLSLRVLGTMQNSGAGLRGQLLPQYEQFLQLNQGRSQAQYSEAQWRQLQSTIQSLKDERVMGVGLNGRPKVMLDEQQLGQLQGFAGAMGGILVEQPLTFAENEQNIPGAIIEVLGANGESLGIWIGSAGFGPTIPPQTFTYKERTYEVGLRPLRHYQHFWLDLQEARHDLYPGTQIPRNFSSQVIITNPQSGESRPALIYMNNPLRYGGLTFYQYQMESQTGRSVLQVVRNPSWLVPYIAVGLVGLGMTLHFSLSLLRFTRRRNRDDKTGAQAAKNGSQAQPAKSKATDAARNAAGNSANAPDSASDDAN